MQKRRWRVIRLFAVLAGGGVCVVLLAFLSLYGYYRSIVGVQPGELDVEFAPGDLGQHVNVFSGTGGIPYVCAYNSPAATMPFGMVRLAPDTASPYKNMTVLNASGYYFADTKVLGFSHTRLLGADAREGGHFRIMPTVESMAAEARRGAYLPKFSHRGETAFPGYYAVLLPREDVLVECTATTRVGLHRYTFRNGEAPHLLLDVTSTLGDGRSEKGQVRILPDAREVEGRVTTHGSFAGRYGGLDVFFVARFTEPFAGTGIWTEAGFEEGALSAEGDTFGVDVAFEPSPEPQVIEVRLALSYVSIDNARLNLDTEAAGKTFEDVFAAARDAWEERLARIQIESDDEVRRRIFYTALYRTFQMPTQFNDVNGQYRGFDKEVHEAGQRTYYTDFSMWDTFRTLHPLYNLVARSEQSDMMASLVEMAKAGGCIPRWAAGCGYTNCMMGTPGDIAISEAYLKGIRDFDIETAYEAMRKTALEGKPEGTKFAGRKALDSYLKLGYCPSEKASKAVSRTLEWTWADHALSLLAKELGHEEDAAVLAKHAQNYRNLWNPETQYFQPKDSDGVWFADFDPLQLSYTDFDRKYTEDYCEGSALQWRWAVPFDPEGLISLFESREYFIDELNTFFAKSTKHKGEWNPGSYYWQGNEPDIHSAYLFNTAGRPDLTQKWIRWILDTKYGDDYVGLDGNDDGATLSAWYVLSALGFYPIAGTTRYELGAPSFPRAVVNMGRATLTVTADNFAKENIYVSRVWLNDKLLDRTWFTHDEIADGGTLRFEMSPAPVT